MTKAPEAMKPSRKERARDFKASLSGAARIMVETENALGEYDVQTFRPDEVTALLAAERERALREAAAIVATSTTRILALFDTETEPQPDLPRTSEPQDAKPDWEGFGRAIMQVWQEHCDLDAADRFELALNYNLLREIEGGFDPEAHEDQWGNAEEGDPWYEENFTFKKDTP